METLKTILAVLGLLSCPGLLILLIAWLCDADIEAVKNLLLFAYGLLSIVLIAGFCTKYISHDEG